MEAKTILRGRAEVKRLVFLVEEPSMGEVLDILMPLLLPEGITHQVVPHEGKSDLEKSIPRKLKAWRETDVRFVVLRDNDGGDCKALKQRLSDMCSECGRSDTLIRIVCQELESWYLADLTAVALAYADTALVQLQEKAKFRSPDRIKKPSDLIKRHVPAFEKIAGARSISPHLDLTNERSHSFKVFVSGVRRVVGEM